MMLNQVTRFTMNENGYLFDPHTGLSYMTNSTGLAILKAIRESRDADETIKVLVEGFDVSTIEAERDLIDFMELLRSKGIVS